MSLRVRQIQAENRQLRKAVKAKAPLTKDGEDKRMIAYWYMMDAVNALNNAASHLALGVDPDRCAALQSKSAELCDQAKALKAEIPRRRR